MIYKHFTENKRQSKTNRIKNRGYSGRKVGSSCSGKRVGSSCSGRRVGISCSGRRVGSSCSGRRVGSSCSGRRVGSSCSTSSTRCVTLVSLQRTLHVVLVIIQYIWDQIDHLGQYMVEYSICDLKKNPVHLDRPHLILQKIQQIVIERILPFVLSKILLFLRFFFIYVTCCCFVNPI